MNKLNVLQIINSLDTGGAEVLAVNIANLLSDRGLNSHICATRKEGKLLVNIKNEVGYLFLEKKRIFDLRAILTLKKYVKDNKISIIHAHSSSFFLAVLIKLLSPKLTIIWHDHYGKTQELKNRKKKILQPVSFLFKTIISVNNQLKEWSSQNLYCKNIYILNNFPVFNNDDALTKLKGLEGKRIIHLAAFREQKDHETLLNTFNDFLKENKDWTLHFVGNIYNDKYSNKIKELIKEKKLEKHTFVYGSCLDIKNVLKQADIGVLSSKSEGLPLALLEYGLTKLPVISTNVGDCSKVILHNETGFLVSPQNSNEFEEKLKKLSKSKKLQSKFGENLYHHVQEKFSSELFIRKLIRIYKE